MIRIDTDDLLKIKIQEDVSSMLGSDQERVETIDSLIASEKKGLIVTFDLSHSGKVINGRIYPPQAQSAHVGSWKDLPVLKHHNTDEDPIGRIIDAQYVSLDNEARAFLGDLAFAEVKAAFDSNDREAIHRVFNKHNLGRPEWPGLGKIVAKARIGDKDAIEKFLDERFLHFSAGARHNAISCTKCGSRPGKCKHDVGVKTSDGDISYLITGSLFQGREASVVNQPADGKARVLHMSFESTDSEEAELDFDSITDWDENISTVDCELDLTVPQKEVTSDAEVPVVLNERKTLEIPTVISTQDTEEEPDWYILDLALQGMLTDDQKLSSEKRDELDDSVFCGPDRSFPVHDCAHVTAARALIGRYKGPGSKDKILACINDKAAKLGCDSKSEDKCEHCSKDYAELKVKYETVCATLDNLKTIQVDYERALKDYETLVTQFNDCLNLLAKEHFAEEKNISDFIDKKLDEKVELFVSIVSNRNATTIVDSIQQIESPSGTINQLEDREVKLRNLTSIQQKIIDRYKELLSQDSESTAEHYLINMKRRGHLPHDFSIIQYI